jgi:hypothetical protein
LRSQNAVLDAGIERIDMEGLRYRVSLRRTPGAPLETRVYDRVIVCSGFQFDGTMFDNTCRPALTINDRLPEQTAEWESTTVGGLYFAGSLMQARDYRRTASSFIHGFRYNVRALHHILGWKYHGQNWPSRLIPPDSTSLSRAISGRIQMNSDLWHMPGFLCDVVVVPPDRRPLRYYEGLPVDYVRKAHWLDRCEYYTLTMEFGGAQAPDSGLAGGFHAIVRQYVEARLFGEHHITGQLKAPAGSPEHVLS